MAHLRGRLTAALILFTLQVATSAKSNARPVYEVVSEQARMADIRLSNAPSILPYGNPLAGNSAQNARLHASNQQAMFNAEKVRQHKAQLHRLTHGPPIIDSYMKAYHESQESHQMALEQQQAGIKEIVPTTPLPNMRKQLRNRTPQIRQRTSQSNRERNGLQNQRQEFKSRMPNLEQQKLTRANAVTKERSRNHRSYDSVEYEQYLQSKFPLTYLAATAPDQGVTIKPNGNVGITKEQEKVSSNLHTTIVPSIGKYLPKAYLTVKEINALESILRKNPNDQLTEFKTFINSEKDSDLHYPLKDLSPQNVPEYYQSEISPSPSTYTVKDHTPITEQIDDIENPVQYQNTYATQQFSTEAPLDPTVTNNYYKVEVASQTVSAGIKPSKINEDLYLNQDQLYRIDAEDENESFHNYANGVQHLAEDGTGVSAYGNDNVSTKVNLRFKRSKLDTEPFLLPASNETVSETPVPSNETDIPVASALRRPFHKKRNDFNVFLSPNFQVGEATDYDDYEEIPKAHPAPKFEAFYDDDEYYDDLSSNDYDEPSHNPPIGLAEQPLQNTHLNYPSIDSRGSYSHRFKQLRRPNHGSLYSHFPTSSYGVPSVHAQAYNPSLNFNLPTVNSLVPNLLEPVYMLTESQLKELIGQPNLNIEHLDVYQVKEKKKVNHPRKYRKRYPYRHRNFRNNLHKLQTLKLV